MKLISYNIENYENDWQTRINLIAKLIKDTDAGIVALSEVRGHFDGTPNEAEVLQGALGGFWHLAVSEAMDYTPPNFHSPYVWEGLAILSREDYPMIQTGSQALAMVSGDANRRIVQFASFEILGLSFYLFNYHATLGGEPGYGENLQAVLNYINETLGNAAGIALLVGDLNQPHEANFCGDTYPCVPPELKLLEDAGWTDLWMNFWSSTNNSKVGYTWPLAEGEALSKRLDYQWATQDLMNLVTSIDIIGDQPVNGMYLSDHVALISDFSF